MGDHGHKYIDTRSSSSSQQLETYEEVISEPIGEIACTVAHFTTLKQACAQEKSRQYVLPYYRLLDSSGQDFISTWVSISIFKDRSSKWRCLEEHEKAAQRSKRIEELGARIASMQARIEKTNIPISWNVCDCRYAGECCNKRSLVGFHDCEAWKLITATRNFKGNQTWSFTQLHIGCVHGFPRDLQNGKKYFSRAPFHQGSHSPASMPKSSGCWTEPFRTTTHSPKPLREVRFRKETSKQWES